MAELFKRIKDTALNFKEKFKDETILYREENPELFDYLKKRKGLIDGVCISGGEPLLQKDIEQFIKKIKEKL